MANLLSAIPNHKNSQNIVIVQSMFITVMILKVSQILDPDQASDITKRSKRTSGGKNANELYEIRTGKTAFNAN
ncbi:hypothetical protein TNCT_572831 [Trichonephila clavata]|uniref:Uncharacterized protein n=1 Tax=Trichonephila clavata TaxID=2740835 RepID=A0A8X6J038_TRICU|nr:hypothetical protein TNCT_572831 [Trichonephila clavata]